MAELEVLADIKHRNAGAPTITVFSDGSFVVHGEIDAHIDQRCDWGSDAYPLVSVRLDTLAPTVAPDLQRQTRLYEKLCAPSRDQAGVE